MQSPPGLPSILLVSSSQGQYLRFNRLLLFAGVLAQEHLKGSLKIENRYFSGDAESARRRGYRRRIVRQTQSRPVATSITPHVRVPVSHMLLLVLF